MGLLPFLSSDQPLSDGGKPPSRLYYRYLRKLGTLVVRAYFLATSQIARIEGVNLKTDQASSKADRAIRLALLRSEGEWRERLSSLSRRVATLSQQNSLNVQIAQLRELEFTRSTAKANRRTAAEALSNSNKRWQLERDLEGLTEELENQTTSTVAEGTNLYFTAERVDDRVAALIQNGTGLTWTYNDGAGTLTGAVSLTPFSTTNLSEGSNLYHTTARARSAVSGTGAISYNSATGVINLTTRTGYAAMTGTAARGAIATYTAPTISAIPTQAEVQAIADALQAISRRLKAHDDDLTTSNIIGA